MLTPGSGSKNVVKMKRSVKKAGRPLKREVLGAIYLCMGVLLVMTMIVGLRFYVISSVVSYKARLSELGDYTLAQMDTDYVRELFGKTKKIYDTLPGEIEKDPFTDEYKDYFRPLIDEKYKEQRKILIRCREHNPISDIYLGFYDEENERLVYVLDGDLEEYYYIPGQYVSNENGFIESWKTIERIMGSDWFMSFSRTALVGFTGVDYIPLLNDDGTLLGVIGIETRVLDFSDDLISYVIIFIPAILVSFILLSTFISRLMERRVIKPINALAKAAGSYTQKDMEEGEENTSHFAEVDVSSALELVDLRNTMAKMEDDIRDSIRKIARVSAERERITAELSIASEIQQAALPTGFPEGSGFELFAAMHPAKEVAGDFYDFFMIDDDHLALIMADVSGKGVPAALFMMKGKEILKNRAVRGGKPSEVIGYANSELARDNERAMFITVWLGFLEISTGKLTAANAGHEYPFIMDEKGRFEKYDDPHGMVCGLMEDFEYEDYTVTIPRGGGLFLYTDGIPEAENDKGEYFGMERTEEILNRYRDSSAKDLIEGVKKEMDGFASGAEQFDDITMLCLFMKQGDDK